MLKICNIIKSAKRLLSVAKLKGGMLGAGLVEVLVALALMGGVGIMAVSALSTGSKSTGLFDQLATAENIAQAQLEYTKSVTYDPLPATYDIISPLPANYSVTVEAYAVTGDGEASPRTEMQKIVVTIYHQSEQVFKKEGYKVDR